MDPTENWLLRGVTSLVPLLLSLSVHEWAHAWSARLLGDDTAEKLGRVTLNPFAHIDPVGTLLLPLLGVPFGWAKPVPVNPIRFRRDISMGMGVLIVAAAGPISNLCLAAAFTGLLAVTALLPLAPEGFKALLETMVLLNVVLAVFNLLPIPPLDGSRIVDAFVPREMRPAWDAFARIAPVALIAVLVLPSLTGFSLLDWPVEQVRRLIEAVKR